jgi:putative FmdB family regulatory protein
MPVFEYRCPICGNILERYESTASQDGVVECAECGNKMKKIEYYSNPLSFKGSGWYVTDYGKGKQEK